MFVGDTSGPEWAPKPEDQKRGQKYRAPPGEKAKNDGCRVLKSLTEAQWERIREMAQQYGYTNVVVLVREMVEACLAGKIFIPENRLARVELHEIRAAVRAQDRLKEAAFERARLRGEIVGAGDGGKLPFGLNDPRLKDSSGG